MGFTAIRWPTSTSSTRKNYNPNPPRHFDELPLVTIQLPIFNEQFVIDRLIEAICAIEYPKEKLEIQVLDRLDR